MACRLAAAMISRRHAGLMSRTTRKTTTEHPMSSANSSDGTKIACEVIGDGPALVLVDGALCRRDFGPSTPLAKELADRFTVFTYDRRGRGESGDTPPYAVDRELEDLGAVIDEAGG